MASTVNVGALEATLKVGDQYSAIFAKVKTDIKAVSDRLAKLEADFAKSEKETKKTTDTTNKLEKEYKKVAATLDPVAAKTQKYEHQVETLNKALKAGIINQTQYNTRLAQAQSNLQTTTHWTQRLGTSIGTELTSNFARFLAVSALVSGAIALVTSVSKQLIQANVDAEASSKRVEEAVRRYGDRSGVTAEQIDLIAQSASRLTGIDDELIADAEVIGLKFNRIGSEIFPRFAKAAIDMGAATGDMGGAFEKAGKLVNQPLRALTLFAKEGYAVGKSQSDLIKNLVAAGEIQLAQVEILKILEGQYGGAAVAARDTMGGALKALQTTWENFLERVGQDNMGPIRSALESLITLLEHATDGVKYVEIGFHSTRAAVNGFVADALSRIADLIDLLSDAASLLGKFGVAAASISRDVSGRARNAAGVAAEDAIKHGMAAANLLAGIGQGHRNAASAALEQTEAEAKLGNEIEKVTSAVKDSIAEMVKRATSAKNAWMAASIGIKEYRMEILAQKVGAAILKEEIKLREIGLSLTDDQRDTIANAVIDQENFNRKLQETLKLNEALIDSMLTATDNIAGKGFEADFKRFTDNAHRGMELIQIDVEEMLTGLGKIKDLDLEIEFNSRLMDVEPHLRNLEADYLSFLENIGSGFELAGENAIEAGERIIATLGERFGVTIDEIRDKLQSLNDAPAIEAFQLAGRSVLQVYRDEQKEIKRIVAAGAKEGIDVTEGGQRAINDLQQQFWSENLSNWSSALNFLASEFGGFFSYLARAVQSLQQAQGFGQSVSGMASGMGASAATSGALGAMGGTVAVFAMIYSWGKELLAASKSRNYGTGTDFSLRNFQESTSQLDAGARETVKAIRGMIKSLEDALRISISDLGEIGIKVRNDGEKFKAYFKGVLIGKFNSFEEAIGEALRLAFSDPSTIIQGLSDLMKQGLKEFTVPDFEELTDFLADLREISDLQLGGNAVQFIESIRHLDDLWQTLNKLREVTPAVTQGFQDLITTEIRSWQAWSDSITGRQKTPAELLAEKKQEAEMFEAQKKFRIAELELKKLGLQADLAWLQGKGNILQGDGKLKQGELNLGISFLQAKGELFKAELTLNEQWILAIQAQIEAITVLINSLAEIPTIDIDKIKIPKGKGGGQKDAVRDWIGDKRFELNTRGMDEWARRAADISRQYDQQLEQAGKDKKIRAELIALKERELALLDQEHMAAVQGSYDDFTKQASAFEQVRDTASELIKSIEGSPFGNAKKAEMIANVFEEINRQIEELSLSEAASLFSGLIGEMEKFGASESELSEARKHLAIIEHTLNVINYRTRFEILKAEGKLSKEILSTLDKSIKFVEGVDPLKIIDGITGSGEPLVSSEWLARQTEMSTAVDKTVSDLEKLREAFIDAKTRIIDEVLAFDRGEFGAIVPEQSWAEAQRQFDAIISSAKLGNIEAFQDAPEAFRNTLDVLKGFSPALFATLAPQLRDQFKGLADLTTIKQGNVVITDFEKRTQHKEVVNTLSGGFSSLSSISSEQAETLNRILAEQQKSTSANEDIKNRLVRLESGTFGKREIA